MKQNKPNLVNYKGFKIILCGQNYVIYQLGKSVDNQPLYKPIKDSDCTHTSIAKREINRYLESLK